MSEWDGSSIYERAECHRCPSQKDGRCTSGVAWKKLVPRKDGKKHKCGKFNLMHAMQANVEFRCDKCGGPMTTGKDGWGREWAKCEPCQRVIFKNGNRCPFPRNGKDPDVDCNEKALGTIGFTRSDLIEHFKTEHTHETLALLLASYCSQKTWGENPLWKKIQGKVKKE